MSSPCFLWLHYPNKKVFNLRGKFENEYQRCKLYLIELYGGKIIFRPAIFSEKIFLAVYLDV